MRLYNPTYEDVFSKCAGVVYYIKSQKSIEVSKETGEWLLDKYRVYGIVDISSDSFEEGSDHKNYIAKKAMEGIRTHLAHLHEIIDQFIQLDSEIKAVNYNGTVLNHKRVKEVMERIKVYTGLLEKLEDKFGFSIATEELKQKEISLFDSINAAVTAFEADTEAKERTQKINHDVDRFLKDTLGEISAIS